MPHGAYGAAADTVYSVSAVCICRAYFRDTLAYRIVLKSETTGQELQAVTESDGENFRAAVSVGFYADKKMQWSRQFRVE